MGLKIFINCINLHTGRLPMAVSSGLKRSQRVSKCHETLGAEHIRASHMVSQCHETLGAERIRALHEVSICHEILGAERVRASHLVPKCNEILAAEHIRASHMVSQCHETLGAERIRALHEVSMCCETLGLDFEMWFSPKTSSQKTSSTGFRNPRARFRKGGPARPLSEQNASTEHCTVAPRPNGPTANVVLGGPVA